MANKTTGICKVCKKIVNSNSDKLAMNIHLSCWNSSHKRLKKYSRTVKIKKVKLRLEINLHDLWFGLFWITRQDMYFGVPCLVFHVWKDSIIPLQNTNKSKKRFKKYSKIIKIKKIKLRLELNLHNLWLGNFWITRQEMYCGIPCLVIHAWK